MANVGKSFESDWKSSIPPDVYYYRLRDGTASFYKSAEEMESDKNIRFQMKNDYDCIMFKMPFLFTLELKSYAGTSFTLSSLSEGQRKGLLKASKYQSIITGVVFNIRKLEQTYFVNWSDIQSYINTATAKSIPNKWIIENGIQIVQWKKKVNYNYDIRKFIDHFDKF